MPLRYIEGVGPNLGWYINRDEYHNPTILTTCMYKDGVQVYLEPSLDSCDYTGLVIPIDAVETIEVQPAFIENLWIDNNVLTIDFKRPGKYHISVKDISGKVLKVSACENNTEFKTNLNYTGKFIILTVYDEESGIVSNHKIVNTKL